MTIQGELFRARGSAARCPASGWSPTPSAPAEEAALAAHVDAAPLEPFRFGQWRGKRLTTHYGSAYDFARGRVEPAPPLPGWLAELRACLAPLVGARPGGVRPSAADPLRSRRRHRLAPRSPAIRRSARPVALGPLRAAPAPPHRDRLRAPQRRPARDARSTCSRARSAGTGSTRSPRRTRRAARSPSARCADPKPGDLGLA